MRYYFFQTSQQMRDGEMKPTLRALPGQTFPDGTPVDTNINVRAPKNAGQYPFGNRLDYPDGTFFCSDYLAEERSKNGVLSYTVFASDQVAPNFHPVSDDSNFKYVKPEHCVDTMNAAFTLFRNGLYNPDTDDDAEESSEPLSSAATTAFYTPFDENGDARPENKSWKERYQGQLSDEMQMFGKWLRSLFAERKVMLPSRILMDTVEDLYKKLYRMGETLDTLASRPRFEAFLTANGLAYADFEIRKDGPLKKYLEWIEEEHEKRSACSAVERNPQDRDQLADALTMIASAHENVTGLQSPVGPQERDNLKKAFEAGWVLDDLLDPDNLKKAGSIQEYASKLASGAIALPVRCDVSAASFLQSLLADKKNRKPTDSSGFHVEEAIWNTLVWAFGKKKNTLLTGPTGSGKTQIVKLLAEKTGMPLTIIQMGAITDPTEQLVGKMDFDSLTGSTKFDWATFAQAIQQPGIILLDEVNRIPRNGYNMLFSCLDDTRCLPAYGAKGSDQRNIPVHKDCMFIATANIGSEYTGVAEMDAAFRRRFFPELKMTYMTQAQETNILMRREDISKEDATNIAFVANRIRMMAQKDELQSGVSTRETLQCAEMIHDGFTIVQAMETAFLPLYEEGTGPNDPTSERAQVKQIIAQRFSNTKK